MAAPLVLLFLLAVVLASMAGPTVTAVVTTVTAASAGAACLVQAGRRRGRVRFTWLAIGGGMLASATSAGSGPGAGHLVMVVLASAGLLALPSPARTRVARVRTLIDSLLIALSLLIVAYDFLIGPLLAAGRTDLLIHPIADVVLGTVALLAVGSWHRGHPAGRAMPLISVALLLLAIGDSLEVAVRHVGGSAGDWLAGPEAIAFAAAGLVLLAVHGALPRSGPPPAPEPDEDRRPVASMLPYAAVLTTLLIVTFWIAAGGHSSPLTIWCRFSSILLIVARQVLLVRENRALTRHLESRVAERAAELQGREMRFRGLVEQSSDSLAILDADSIVRWQSESVQRIFGIPATFLVGRPLIDLIGAEAGARVRAGIDEVRGEPRATTVFEIMLPHADGSLRMAEMTVTNLLDDPFVRGFVFNTRDVSDARELQRKLRHDAYHDPLTGLANRALFRERLAEAVEDDWAGVAILFLDLDGFKEINDSLGHAAGDQLLAQVAERLRATVAEPYVVARLGGDEFAVIVRRGKEEAEALATAILAALDAPFPVDGRELRAGAGIGVASTADALDVEQLQRNADLAMYRAKDAGGGVYATYHPGMHDALVRRLELESDLRLALERDELVLHYQPTVDLRSGEIVGFEALVRWQHPTRGMVPPLDFIGVAESTGLIVPLGRWVLTEACRQAVAWGDRPLKMAVNVSVRQFDGGDLAATVAEVLAGTGMPADRLCLEMTESVLLTDTDDNLERILRLKALGVTLAMDDFGTGFSSLAYLRRFPMDVLKVDRSFVDRLGGAREDEALVRTIVRLGQRFGMATVAEGVEDEVQLAALREMGCDQAQGYFMSRPLPAAEAGRALERGVPLAAV